MKKILFVLPSLVVGGMEKMAVTLANKLDSLGNSVTLMLLDNKTDLQYELSDKVRLIHKPYKAHLGQKLPYLRSKYYDDGMWETRAKAEQLYNYYVGKEKFDVEIAFFRGLPVKIISGSTDRAAVHLAWVHNDFRRAKGFQNNFRSAGEVFAAYSSFDRVICVSNEAQAGFIETVGDTGNLTTIYNLLPAERIRALAEETPPEKYPRAKLHAAVVARLHDSSKGQLRLINAVTKLHNEGADISLSIVGGGEDYEKFQKAVKDRNAESYITLHGPQNNPYPYIKNADLLVCSSYYEGFNLTVAEALILGVPVLSTDCTGPREILDGGKYGILVKNSDEGLYNGLKQIVEHSELLSEYREKAKARQSFFDENKITNQIISLLGKEE